MPCSVVRRLGGNVGLLSVNVFAVRVCLDYRSRNLNVNLTGLLVQSEFVIMRSSYIIMLLYASGLLFGLLFSLLSSSFFIFKFRMPKGAPERGRGRGRGVSNAASAAAAVFRSPDVAIHLRALAAHAGRGAGRGLPPAAGSELDPGSVALGPRTRRPSRRTQTGVDGDADVPGTSAGSPAAPGES